MNPTVLLREGCKMHMIELKLFTRNTYINSEYLLPFLVKCGRSFSFSSEDTEIELHQRLSADNSAWSSQTTPNLVKLVLPVLQCLVPASLSFCQWWTFCDRAFLGMLTSRFHQWNVLSGSSSCFVHLVFCSFEILACLLVVTVLPVRPTIHWSIFGRVLRWCDPFS